MIARGGAPASVGVEVLGPIRVHDVEGRDVTPDGALQRRLLALLVLRRGHVVTVDAAIDTLWPVSPPRDPVAALHNHVFRLRRSLPAGVIDSTGEGYRLNPASVDLDVERLAAAVNSGEAAAPAVQATLDAILDRWHGPAYPELADVDAGRAESVRLEELRIRAAEARAEGRLATGGDDELAVELAALVDAEPLRERPRALLMEALARGGRTPEALRVYDDFRRRLGDELGTEPSPALAAQHAALLTGGVLPLWRPASRLPAPVTSLIGREALAAEVKAMVGKYRLVTLIGPGGVGKTRLLTEVGRRLQADRSDRPVVMCELATATAESAVDAVATALSIEGRPDTGLTERVAAVVGDTELVLLLDNCEHVLEPIAALVDHMLGRCPHVTVLTTSRERLRVPGEQLRPVPTLSTDTEDSPAVQLFVERARAVAPNLDASVQDGTVIDDIVRRLDGLPLAIELAAARLQTLDLDEVAAGLDRRFGMLSAGYRTSTRHGSLRAAVAWSVDMLDESMRRTFIDLSVFAGSFSVADAAAICGTAAGSVAESLDRLVERSLVQRTYNRRYVLLETLRAFGAEELIAVGRAAEVGERHARYLVAWAESADRRMNETGRGAIDDIDAKLPELRLALGWTLDQGQAELAGRLVVALLDYAIMRLRPDVLAWAERVTAADPDDGSSVASSAWAMSAYAAWMSGDLDECAARSACARRAGERHGRELPSETYVISGNVELFSGHLDVAAEWYRRAVEAAAAADNVTQEWFARGTLLLALGYAGDPGAVEVAEELLADVGDLTTAGAAYIWFCAGEADLAVDVERSRQRLAHSLDLAEHSGASFVTGLAGASLASIEARTGDPLAAAADYRRLVTHWRRAGMWSTQWTMLRSIAGLLARLGRHREAAVLLGAVRATHAGHRIFGGDAAALAELGERLRAELGEERYEAALAEGSVLDGDAAVEHALGALGGEEIPGVR